MALIKKPQPQLWHAWSHLRWKLRYIQDMCFIIKLNSSQYYSIFSTYKLNAFLPLPIWIIFLAVLFSTSAVGSDLAVDVT